MAHELGNLLAGIRLTGHFLGEEVSAAERTRWSGDIEFLSAQAGAWALLVAPLAEGRSAPARVAASDLLEAVQWSVADLTGAARLTVPKGRGTAPLRIEQRVVHQLVLLLATSALAETPEASVRLTLSARPRHVVLSLLDDVAPIELPSSEPAHGGRELMVEVGDALLRQVGGRLEMGTRRAGNRFDLWLPKAPAPRAKAKR